MGPTYYMRLKHMVKDKINYRARGPMTNLTRQPVSGRANDGGLRIGEMERDGVISHGASIFLQESMMERGDAYQIAVCNKTGMIAIYNPNKNILFSPMADGPIKYTGGSISEGQIQQFSKFGRDFSIVAIPYSFKLFMQELFAMNIRMSLITEDNISQIENMTFSTSIDPKQIIEETRQNIYKVPNSTPDTDLNYPPISTTPPSPDTTPPRLKLPPPVLNTTPPPSSPPSLDLPPSSPPPPELKGGAKVHYRGDIKPSRVWNIEHVGSNFCTINTEDDYHLNTEDTIKIVRPDEIYLPNENYTYSMPIDIPQQNNIPFNNNPIVDPTLQTPPNINFAPVIKIINDGNDMSTQPFEQPVVQQSQQPFVQQLQPVIQQPQQSQENLNISEIDFSIPIIKK